MSSGHHGIGGNEKVEECLVIELSLVAVTNDIDDWELRK